MSRRILELYSDTTTRRVVALTLCAMAALVLACQDVVQPRHAVPLQTRRSTVVTPDSMRGWVFYDDQHDSVCTVASVCRLVQGPGSPTLGSGSAEVATPTASDGKALLLAAFAGTRFDAITDLHYATFRQSSDAGNNLAISLQFNVDYDLTDGTTSYMGRLVFEPYQGVGGNVAQNTWQTWDAKAGKWWGTRSTVTRGGASVTNPCVQATPCTWPQLLSAFPNIGVHATLGAVVLKAGSNWAGFRGNVDNLTIGVNGANTIYDFELTSVVIPPLAPANLPVATLDSLGTFSVGETAVVQHMVAVAFARGTPQSARQAAIQSINGIVIGGIPIDDVEGEYLVRIPGGTLSDINNAVAAIKGFSTVSVVGPVIRDTIGLANYLTPHDGTGWRSWKLNPDSSNDNRANWALEFTSAPLAWGCSTGDTLTSVAVVDGGITDAPNYHQNVFLKRYVFSSPPGDPGWHGTQVAGILADVGNDSVAGTGMMWRAQLSLWDYAVDTTDIHGLTALPAIAYLRAQRIAALVVAAGQSGAKIINVSQGLKLPAPQDTTTAQGVALISIREVYHSLLLNSLKTLAASTPPRAPLVVLSAGNVSQDAKWNGFTEVRDDPQFTSQVLVVGESTGSNARSGDSNVGSLLDIFAPSYLTSVWGPSLTVPDFAAGSSFAAPLVSGAAGLAAAFDPSLTAAQLKDYVVRGSSKSPRRIDGKPILNAYEILKLISAERSTAPLCGNQQVWIQNGQMFVARDSVSAPTLIGNVGAGAWDVDVYHGGRWIDYQTPSGDFGALRLTSSGWVAANSFNFVDTPNGSYQSAHGASHDGNAGMWGFAEVLQTGMERVRVFVSDSLGRLDSTFKDFPAGDGSLMRRTWGIERAYPQRGDSALLAVVRVKGTDTTLVFECTDDRGVVGVCSRDSLTWRPDTTYLFSMKVGAVTGAPVLNPVRTMPDTLVYSLGFSEDDQTTVLSVGSETATRSSNFLRALDYCELQYRNPRAGGTPKRRISTPDACPSFTLPKTGLGGFSANRLPRNSSLYRLQAAFQRTPAGRAQAAHAEVVARHRNEFQIKVQPLNPIAPRPPR